MNRQPIQDNRALIETLEQYSRVGLIYARVDFRKEEEIRKRKLEAKKKKFG